MWIEGRELPGGVPQFFATQTSVWYQTLGSTSVVAMIFMGDAFLVCLNSTLFDDGTDTVRTALPPLHVLGL